MSRTGDGGRLDERGLVEGEESLFGIDPNVFEKREPIVICKSVICKSVSVSVSVSIFLLNTVSSKA